MHAVRILHANIPILNTMIYAYFSLAYSHCYSHIHFVTNIWLNSEFLRGGGANYCAPEAFWMKVKSKSTPHI